MRIEKNRKQMSDFLRARGAGEKSDMFMYTTRPLVLPQEVLRNVDNCLLLQRYSGVELNNRCGLVVLPRERAGEAGSRSCSF